MADRARQPPAAPPRRNVAPPGGVSRNLFQSRLTRRPTPIAGVGPSSAAPTTVESSAEAIRMAAAENEDSDFIVRDRNGDIEIGELPMAGVLDEGDEGVMHDQEESKRMFRRSASRPEGIRRLHLGGLG